VTLVGFIFLGAAALGIAAGLAKVLNRARSDQLMVEKPAIEPVNLIDPRVGLVLAVAGAGAVFVVILAMLGPPAPSASQSATTDVRIGLNASNAEVHVVNFACSYEYGFMTVGGEIRNISNSPIRNLMVVASHYASDGTFIRSDSGMVEYNPLMPGQTSPFKAMGTYNPMMSKCKVGFKRMFGGAVEIEN
jgi:hypothetical protein